MEGTVSVELWRGDLAMPDQTWTLVDHTKFYFRDGSLFHDNVATEWQASGKGVDGVAIIIDRATKYLDLAIKKQLEIEDIASASFVLNCGYIETGVKYSSYISDLTGYGDIDSDSKMDLDIAAREGRTLEEAYERVALDILADFGHEEIRPHAHRLVWGEQNWE